MSNTFERNVKGLLGTKLGMTQVWDAEVTDETSGKVIAQFRCTQMVLYRES